MKSGLSVPCGLLLAFGVWPNPVAGQPAIQTVAGSGRSLQGAGGPATNVALGRPQGLAVDTAGNVYVSDIDLNVIVKITPADILTVYAGTGIAGYTGDGGPATQADIRTPYALAFDQFGNLDLTQADGSLIRQITTAGIISTIAGGGPTALEGGLAIDSFLWQPGGLAFDSVGNMYIAESENHRVTKVDKNGIITTVAGTLGSAGFSGDGGPATHAQINFPTGLVVDSSGSLYICDRDNNRIRRVSPDGTIRTIVGGGTQIASNGALATDIALSLPQALTFDASGKLTFPDVYDNLILRLNSDGTVTIIGGTVTGGFGQMGFSGDGGPATAASLNLPMGLGFDASGNLYFADYNNHRVRKIDTHGVISTIAGDGKSNYGGDGGPAVEALLDGPQAIAVSPAGDLYIADTNNNRVRRVTSSGTIMTVAGTGVAGYSGDGGQATQAQLDLPAGVAVDATGNLYISDTWNWRIRRVDTTGKITTVAGTGQCCYSDDGGSAISAKLNQPGQLRFDGLGNLYFADQWNHRIRKITPTGTISTVAGNGQQGFGGDGGPSVAASLNWPSGVVVAQDGSLLIADLGNSRVRRVSLDGTMSTISGNGNVGFTPSTTPTNTNDEFPADVVQGLDGNIYFPVGTYQIARLNSAGVSAVNQPCCRAGFAGDGGSASDAVMNFNGGGAGAGLAIDANGDLYVADSGNDRIRKITLRSVALSTQKLSFSYPGPSGGTAASLQVTNTGESILQWTAAVSTNDGAHWLTISANSGTAPSTIVVTANVASLAPGTYTGSITVSSPAAVGSPGAVQVSLTVTQTANQVPVIASVQDAESGRASIVPGEWVAVYGSNLAGSARSWTSSDFTSGNALPVNLDGVSVQFNGAPAAVYSVSSGLVNVQAPSGLSGSVAVTVTWNGASSVPFTTTVMQNAPSLFVYSAGSDLYAAAVHLDSTLVGDPALVPNARKALPGEIIEIFVNGLGPSPAGTIVSSAIPYSSPVTAKIGAENAPTGFAGLVAAGEYQINVTVPKDLATGNYPIAVSTQGQTSPAGVVLPVGQ